MKTDVKAAIAASALIGLSAGAQAAVVTFENLDANLLGHGAEFAQNGFAFRAFSAAPAPEASDLVGALVDGGDLANTCTSVTCPGNNSSKFYTGLNDGGLSMVAQNGSSFSLQGLDASFVGASTDVYPATALLLHVVGTKVGGGEMALQFMLPGPVNGEFSFRNYLATDAFATQQFTALRFYGAACNAGGVCEAFSSNKGQFALDNLKVTAVPEPSSWLLMGLGLLGLAARGRRRQAA